MPKPAPDKRTSQWNARIEPLQIDNVQPTVTRENPRGIPRQVASVGEHAPERFDEALDPYPETVGAHVLEDPEFAAGAEDADDLVDDRAWIVDAAEHQRHHGGVELVVREGERFASAVDEGRVEAEAPSAVRRSTPHLGVRIDPVHCRPGGREVGKRVPGTASQIQNDAVESVSEVLAMGIQLRVHVVSRHVVGTGEQTVQHDPLVPVRRPIRLCRPRWLGVRSRDRARSWSGNAVNAHDVAEGILHSDTRVGQRGG